MSSSDYNSEEALAAWALGMNDSARNEPPKPKYEVYRRVANLVKESTIIKKSQPDNTQDGNSCKED